MSTSLESHSPTGDAPRTVDRETLYRQVWEQPMTSVASQYGISSSFLARVCARLNVPRPPRGYWAQLEVGRAPKKPELPDPRPGELLEWSRDGSLPRIAKGSTIVPAVAKSSAPPRRPPRVTQHEVLARAQEYFDAATEFDNGYLRPAKRRLIDLFVSRDSLKRALDLAKSLVLAIESRGHRVVFAPLAGCTRPAVDERINGGPKRDSYGYGCNTWGPDRPTVAYVGPVVIGLTIFELSKEVEVRRVDGKYVRVSQLPITERLGRYASSTWTDRQHMPSGRLCIRASSAHIGVEWERQWREEKKGELKPKVRQIAAELEAAAPKILVLVEEANRQAEIRRREWEVQQEKWRREAEERRRAQNLKESRAELFEIIDAWGVARKIEDFFADVEERVVRASAEDRDQLLSRVREARAMLGGVDALQRFRAWRSADER